jgi:hypothetical protein
LFVHLCLGLLLQLQGFCIVREDGQRGGEVGQGLVPLRSGHGRFAFGQQRGEILAHFCQIARHPRHPIEFLLHLIPHPFRMREVERDGILDRVKRRFSVVILEDGGVESID